MTFKCTTTTACSRRKAREEKCGLLIDTNVPLPCMPSCVHWFAMATIVSHQITLKQQTSYRIHTRTPNASFAKRTARLRQPAQMLLANDLSMFNALASVV